MKLKDFPRESSLRPAWTADDLHAYRHRHREGGVDWDYYVRSKGFDSFSMMRENDAIQKE